MKKATKINYQEVKKLKSFCGVELRGSETFDELLEIEKEEDKKEFSFLNLNLDLNAYRIEILVKWKKTYQLKIV